MLRMRTPPPFLQAWCTCARSVTFTISHVLEMRTFFMQSGCVAGRRQKSFLKNTHSSRMTILLSMCRTIRFHALLEGPKLEERKNNLQTFAILLKPLALHYLTLDTKMKGTWKKQHRKNRRKQDSMSIVLPIMKNIKKLIRVIIKRLARLRSSHYSPRCPAAAHQAQGGGLPARRNTCVFLK